MNQDIHAHDTHAAGHQEVAPHLHLRNLGIDTRQEHVIYMRRDCSICRAEGFEAQTRVQVMLGERSIVASVNMVESPLLAEGEASLSTSAWRALHARAGDMVFVTHAPALDSHSALRAKIYGNRLDARGYHAIIGDIANGRYADIHIAAFVAACAGGRMDLQETIDLTRAMVDTGDRIDWGRTPIVDKHCVGGLPGNRTTPIVVAIVAAAGLTMPKTSSRAITSPAGTADMLEVVTNVTLDLPAMRRVVEQEGGCLVWGGALTLSPADDVLIRVERPLDVDGDAQLVASVLSKKIAAGATHAVIDMPIGPTAKVRSEEDADRLQTLLEHVAAANGLHLRVMRTRGVQPIGFGIGPALEARDVLAVLRREPHAPQDLRYRALTLAAEVLEFGGHCAHGTGIAEATRLLDGGAAWNKFQAICLAQGALREPGVAPVRQEVVADRDGYVSDIDSRRLASVAKLAGAPAAKTAGLDLHVKLGALVSRGMPLFTIHAEAPGELAYAMSYLATHPIVTLSPSQSA